MSKGGHSFEEAIVFQAEDMVLELTKFCDSGLAAPLKKILFMCSAKVIKSLLFGKDVDCSDTELWQAIMTIEHLFRQARKSDLMSYFNILKVLPGDWLGYRDTLQSMDDLQQWVSNKRAKEMQVTPNVWNETTLASRFQEMSKKERSNLASPFTGIPITPLAPIQVCS